MIIYSLTVDKPFGVDTFPPSFDDTEYIQNLVRNTGKYGSVTSDAGQLCLFANETELNAWLDANRLTDSALIADLNTWKVAQGITFNTRVFQLSSTDITVTPVFG